jgi:hypothetical protein
VGLSIETSRWQTKKLLKEIAREHHPIVRLGMGLKGGPRIFFILIFFNQINIFGQNFFLNLVLFSCASPVDVIYEEITSYALTRARCTTLVGTVTRQSSHIICSCATHEAVASIYLTRLLCKIGHRPLFLFLSSIFISSPCGGSIGDFGVLSPIQNMWCHKSTPWVGTAIMLGTCVVLTVPFCCILKFLLEWTHAVGI